MRKYYFYDNDIESCFENVRFIMFFFQYWKQFMQNFVEKVYMKNS